MADSPISLSFFQPFPLRRTWRRPKSSVQRAWGKSASRAGPRRHGGDGRDGGDGGDGDAGTEGMRTTLIHIMVHIMNHIIHIMVNTC